jgi:aromatic ring hydroxylase
MIISGDKYVSRLREYDREIYVKGEKIKNFVNHPNIKPVVNSFAYTYELAKKERSIGLIPI